MFRSQESNQGQVLVLTQLTRVQDLTLDLLTQDQDQIPTREQE